METFEKISQPNYKITMSDIIMEGHPTLRKKATEVSIPLNENLISLGKNMLEFLRNSQNQKIAKKLKLRAGIGLAAPQLDISKKIIALLIPGEDEKITLEEIMYNPKITAYSVQKACLQGGEGCLSVAREVPGLVIRNLRITVKYVNFKNEQKLLKLKGYEAIAVQHEIDHLNGIMFFDHIDEQNPWLLPEGVKSI